MPFSRCTLNLAIYFLLDTEEEALNDQSSLLLQSALQDHSPEELNPLRSGCFPHCLHLTLEGSIHGVESSCLLLGKTLSKSGLDHYDTPQYHDEVHARLSSSE
jgi:hypothetical protein